MISQSSSFELVVELLLDGGHELHFKKEGGMISVKMNSEKMVAISGETLEQIGQHAIKAAIEYGFKRIDGGAP